LVSSLIASHGFRRRGRYLDREEALHAGRGPGLLHHHAHLLDLPYLGRQQIHILLLEKIRRQGRRGQRLLGSNNAFLGVGRTATPFAYRQPIRLTVSIVVRNGGGGGEKVGGQETEVAVGRFLFVVLAPMDE